MYVLTREHNEYDQEGEYYVGLFKNIEDVKNRLNDVIKKDGYGGCDEELLKHILNGGGRRNYEHVWFNLIKENV